MHYNFGRDALDGPLSANQTVNSLTVCLKAAFLGMLIDDVSKRGFAYLCAAILALIQWLIMYDMFVMAPLPYAHALFELALIAEALSLFARAHHK